MAYSLWVKVATVTFTLRNTGKVDGTEVRRKGGFTGIIELIGTG